MSKVSEKFKQILSAIKPKNRISAVLGDANKNFDAGNGQVYVTLSDGRVIKAANAKVPNRRMKVWLGKDDVNPESMQVIGERYTFREVLSSTLPLHWTDTHAEFKSDMAYITGNQYIPLLAIPGSTAFSVFVYGAMINRADGSVTKVTSGEIDISASVPTEGARYVSVQIESDGTISSTSGTEVDCVELLVYTDIPAPDTGCDRIWAVRLYAGQDGLRKDGQINDFVDLRFERGAVGSGSGDVVGPASAVDGNLASYDGTTGKLIQDSGIAAASVITDPETVVSTIVGYGPNVITNGTFDTDATGWNVGAGWAWESDGASGGWMRHTAGSTAALSQDGILVDGEYFLVYISVGGTTGYVTASLDDGSTVVINAGSGPTVNVLMWQYDAGVKISIQPSTDFDGYVDDISQSRPPLVQEAPIDGKYYVRQNTYWVNAPNVTPTVQNLQTSDSPYTMNDYDAAHIWNANAGDCVDNIIAATGSGKRIDIKKTDASANTVTITPNGADTIDGAADYVLLAQYESVTLLDSATGVWYIV